MIFKKFKRNQNKIKSFGRKRKIFGSIVLVFSLLFGKPRLNSSGSSGPNFDNRTIHERVINDRDCNSFENNDQQVILAKADGNPVTPPTNRGPSNFPTPPSGGRPSRSVSVPKYHTTPRVVDPGFGAAANPAGGGGEGGNAEFDDYCPASNKEQSQESTTYDYRSNNPKKKKQSAEECQLDENVKEGKRKIVYRIKEDPGLVRAAKKVCKNPDVQTDVNHLEEELAKGNDNPGIGRKPICKGIIEHCADNGGRLYVRESDGVIEILAKSGKNKSNQQFVINRLREIYG